MDRVTEMMAHVVHVQLDIMAAYVVTCVLLIVMELPVIKIVAFVLVIVSVDSISLRAPTHVLLVAWIVVTEQMQLVLLANLDYME